MDKKHKLSWRRITGVILFIALLFSVGYAAANVFTAPTEIQGYPEHTRLKSDYMLMLVQCTLAIIIMFLPSLVQKKLNLAIPNYMYVMYFIFLFCAVYLGEVRSFYYLVPHWDTLLHTFSGFMLGALGFTLVSILNNAENINMHLSPGFVAFFAFCFAVAAGAVWEIYEYSMDGLLGLNMQKYAFEGGQAKVGREALTDTMKDLIVDAAGALIMTVFGYFNLIRQRKRLKSPNK